MRCIIKWFRWQLIDYVILIRACLAETTAKTELLTLEKGGNNSLLFCKVQGDPQVIFHWHSYACSIICFLLALWQMPHVFVDLVIGHDMSWLHVLALCNSISCFEVLSRDKIPALGNKSLFNLIYSWWWSTFMHYIPILSAGWSVWTSEAVDILNLSEVFVWNIFWVRLILLLDRRVQ